VERPGDISILLERAEAGDADSASRLLPLVYDELHRLAQHHMKSERAGHTLQTTALVHEAFIRLTGAPPAARGTRYFFAAAGEAMRRILVEHARARARIKRGGDGEHAPRKLPFAEAAVASEENDEPDMLRLDAALTQLEREDPEAAETVRLRFFAGLTGDEAALALGVSASTVDRDWAYARARLFRLMQEAGDG
jgi:RNA polymerase sigma factor (TIGR02999 family)